MDFDMGDLVTKAVEESLRKRGRVNVVIAGRSGVGKSTLVNSVFQGQIATTGQGRPVTQETREYRKEGIPVSIFDTRGLEMAEYNETLRNLETFVVARSNEEDAEKHIHVAWLCISEDSRRVEEGESRVAEMLAKHVPLIGIITKARSDHGFRETVQGLMPAAKNIVRVRAIRETDDENRVLEPRGLLDLVDLTMDVVPEGQRNALAAAQRVSLKQKSDRASIVINMAAAAAGVVATSPIPFSDAALIVPVQIGMLAKTSSVYGLSLTSGFLTTLVGSAATALGATYAGRAIVSGLLKLIPGFGTVAGGAVSAATAITLTKTVGEIYSSVLAGLFTISQGEQPSPDAVSAAFAEALRSKLEKVG